MEKANQFCFHSWKKVSFVPRISFFVTSWNNKCECHSIDVAFFLLYGVILFLLAVVQIINPSSFDGYNLVPSVLFVTLSVTLSVTLTKRLGFYSSPRLTDSPMVATADHN